MLRRARRSLPLAILALIVAGLFLARRVSDPDGSGGDFDPAAFETLPTAPAEAAARYVGQSAVICGRVVRATFASQVGGRPTFLNFGRPHPNQHFDAVIWGRERDRFDVPPERLYDDAAVCVAGEVTEYEGVPRIEVRVPTQIRLLRPGASASGGGISRER